MKNYKHYSASNLPLTYEEFGEWMGFNEDEIEDKYAHAVKRFYERAALLINDIQPFDAVFVAMMKYRENPGSTVDIIERFFESDCMTEETYLACMQLYDDMCECEGEAFTMLGFIFDLFVDLYYEFLK